MTAPLGSGAFAMASTHIDCKNLTLAIMIGCTRKQIDRVCELLENAEDAIRHPLLTLGICAELHLDRLKGLVNDKVTKCLRTTLDLAKTHRHQITWEIIDQVRTRRDESKRAEEEVKATKRQLLKALPPAVSSFIEQNASLDDNEEEASTKKPSHNRTNSNFTAASGFGSELDTADQVTNMFSERFADIFAQMEGLVAECRISVEEMSFTADIVSSTKMY
jgi:hypothetical protein